ncbi:DNA-directed RNA polymerase II, 19 kDa polypeptide [Coccomyxa subellipsoidea C-169]|uniref:DNA-directed RNA polymerase II, 19 kDa polypeptide n=1 Tax=Coccomyxa subellipsoidea (strain C-169) TaxID=574566 RepID=I0ZAD5_COCSC|nr:DNA-directed RNA polymerase II, 19 kDa polypeptide [Coccomyxa subellipsoidea C-169]EIE27604.1 DNA-directed RNA polymerase II, 19 kDa polypeptide [Coccomyxa subellipsoidea C-169]|eukprot:XP_005652148.1 DNA-directed RNA polymerase II, 19 kDa polypeptide [Coccomyxa subellipsoidea C-169]
MFILSELEDKVRIEPADLGRPTVDAVTAVIEQLYLDKVVSDLGLVVTIYDILDIQGGSIYASEGAAHYTVKFRLVVFRPFIGEVLVGRLTKCDKTGLHLSLDFFEDIFVPEHALPAPSFFDEAEGLWFWKFEDQPMWLEMEDAIRLRVKGVKFRQAPNALQLRSASEPGGDMLGTAANPFAPMQVVGAIDEDGLGVVSWWDQDDAAEDMAS